MTSKTGLQYAARFWESLRPVFKVQQPQRIPYPHNFRQYGHFFGRENDFFSQTRTFTTRLSKSPRYVASRGFASGLLAFGIPSRATETSQVMSCSAMTIDSTIIQGGFPKKDKKRTATSTLVRFVCRRHISTDTRFIRGLRTSRRHQSSRAASKSTNGTTTSKRNGDLDTNGNKKSIRTNGNGGSSNITKEGKEKARQAQAANVARQAARDHSFMDRLPHIHRPTKEELLAAASNFWQRFRIRFKWLTIRQVRPYTWDEISAFFSMFVVGNFVWIILGTTTFFSGVVWLVNTVFAQEYLAGIIGNYLTSSTGVKVVFESAIVPRWSDGTISFKNVFVSRRPGPLRGKNVEKGSSATAAAAAAAMVYAESDEDEDEPPQRIPDEDQNYTQFDLTINTVNVIISLAKWMNGKGLIVDVEIKGVRGVIDRTHVHWVADVDPRSLRHVHQPGDFEIENFKLEDLLVTIHQPHDFRPFSFSVFSCDLSQLRKQWLFYDLLSANHVSGSFDNSLFTIHPRQSFGPNLQDTHNASVDADTAYPWKKTSRIRIDGLNVDHLNRGVEGPLGWIQSGNVDIVADIMFPTDSEDSITKIVHDLMVRMEDTVASRRETLRKLISGEEYSQENNPLPYPTLDNLQAEEGGHFEAMAPSEDVSILEPSPAPSAEPSSTVPEERKFLLMDLHMQLNDARAAVPLFNKTLSYTSNALVRPIVAYINSRRTIIPVNCRVLKRVSEFDGSWTVYDSGFMDDLSAETYDAFTRDIADADIKRRRMRAVGIWSLQVFMNAFLAAMAGTMFA